jgi:hypothetical protein
LIEVDTPNYELIDDEDEEIHTMVVALDVQRSYRRPRRSVPRERADGEARIIHHYFVENPSSVLPSIFVSSYLHFLTCRFHMDRDILNPILNEVVSLDSYFLQSYDCTGLRVLSALQKVIAAMRILTYGLPANTIDEYVQIIESTARESFEHFCHVVISAFGKEYLHSPNTADVVRLLQEDEAHGFSGMLSSIDCMHWEWLCCPSASKVLACLLWPPRKL